MYQEWTKEYVLKTKTKYIVKEHNNLLGKMKEDSYHSAKTRKELQDLNVEVIALRGKCSTYEKILESKGVL